MAQVERRASERHTYQVFGRRDAVIAWPDSVRPVTERSRPGALVRSRGMHGFTLFDTALGRCAIAWGARRDRRRRAARAATTRPRAGASCARAPTRVDVAAAAGRRARRSSGSPRCSPARPTTSPAIVLDMDARARVPPPRLRRRARDPAGRDELLRRGRGADRRARRARRPSARRSAATRSRSSCPATACSPPTAACAASPRPAGPTRSAACSRSRARPRPRCSSRRPRWTSPASSVGTRPVGEPDEQRAGVVDPGAGARAAGPAHGPVAQRVAGAQRGEARVRRLRRAAPRAARAARPASPRARRAGGRASPRGRAAPAAARRGRPRR